MNKKLYIIRHAKSDWDNNLTDFDRPLNARGRKDAPYIGDYLAKHHESPQKIISSPAKRAITTAHLISNKLNYPLTNIHTVEDIYHASEQTILNEISQVSDDTNILYIFGHNPGLSNMASNLTELPIELKTCCVAILELQVENWKSLSLGTCVLQEYISPKQI